MDKLFRYHRGLLSESLETTIKVNGLADMKDEILAKSDFLSNIRIEPTVYHDNRLPAEWGRNQYYVMADFATGGYGCIGMCNFYERVNGGTATPDEGE